MAIHGGLYLCIKTEGQLYDRIQKLIRPAFIAFIIFFVLSSLYALIYVPHLSDFFRNNVFMFAFLIAVVFCIANVPRLFTKQKYLSAFVFTSLTFSLLLILISLELYPNLIYATNNPENSITVYNASSSIPTLKRLLLFVAIGAPLVATYTFVVYKAFWGKVVLDETSY